MKKKAPQECGAFMRYIENFSGGQYAENVYAALLHCGNRGFRPASVLAEKEKPD
jgi:hypothetical protein